MSGKREDNPPHVRPEDWPNIIMQDMAVFFYGYSLAPNPGAFDMLMQRIQALNLLYRPEHRHGISGAIAGIISLHPQLEAGWRKAWQRPFIVIDECKPPESDADIRRPPEVDYLWMYAVTCGDEYTSDRVVRIAMRQDAVGDAGVFLIRHNLTHPLLIGSMARQAMRTTTALSRTPKLPQESIASLSLFASQVPPSHGEVLYVAWLPPEKDASGALVIRTPDGNPPIGFPSEWDGLPIVAQAATAEELVKWRKLLSQREAP